MGLWGTYYNYSLIWQSLNKWLSCTRYFNRRVKRFRLCPQEAHSLVENLSWRRADWARPCPSALLTSLINPYLIGPDIIWVSNLPSGLRDKLSSTVLIGFIWLSPWKCDLWSRTENNKPWHGKAIFEAGVLNSRHRARELGCVGARMSILTLAMATKHIVPTSQGPGRQGHTTSKLSRASGVWLFSLVGKGHQYKTF